MLEFAIWYHVAIDAMTALQEFDLHKYELASTEWDIAIELWDILKVSNLPSFFMAFSHYFVQIFKDATVCCISPVTPPTWPLLSQPWILSIRPLLCHPSHHPGSPFQFALLLPSVRRLWINTTTKLGSPRFITLQWVQSFLNSKYIIHSNYDMYSPSPLSQVGILQE